MKKFFEKIFVVTWKTIKFLFKSFFVIALLLALSQFAISFMKPSNDRDFEEESKILPHIIINGDTVTIEKLRDWHYSDKDKISREYITRTIKVSDITGVKFLLEPFGKWEGIAHSFLSFEIKNQKPIVLSVEARRENSEQYSALTGLFNKFELWYAWGTEDDFIVRRALYLHDTVLMYPLLVTPRTAEGLFLDTIKITKNLETNPAWYNTFFSNCTNVLADSANRVNKGAIPWHYGRILTGYADNFLYKLGDIPHDKPFRVEEKRYDITNIVKDIYKNGPVPNFSEELRKRLDDRLKQE